MIVTRNMVQWLVKCQHTVSGSGEGMVVVATVMMSVFQPMSSTSVQLTYFTLFLFFWLH